MESEKAGLTILTEIIYRCYSRDPFRHFLLHKNRPVRGGVGEF